MASTATLVYTVTPTPPVSLARTEAALAAVDLASAETDMANFGATLDSDNTTNNGTSALRTIVFTISSAQFAANFPAGQEASPFNDLYTSILGGELGMVVVSSSVVIA